MFHHLTKFLKTPSLVYTIVLIGFLFNLSALQAQKFDSIVALTPSTAVKNTGDKPQSKVWNYAGKWWAVFPNSYGTFIWRLDETLWTSVLKISSSKTVKADCKVMDNVCHILLWRKEDYPSQLVSVEYDPFSTAYKLWHERTSTALITLDRGVEIGTIDIDGNGRMWLASDGITDINVRWSDPPYSSWSLPIAIATGVTTDDICAVISMHAQGQIGVLWSDQNTRRYGFKTHDNDADPSIWSVDEAPASQSALNIKTGMCDDHLNLAIASDGTLYCAIKTGYDTPGYPLVALLKRNTAGVWDGLYEVSQVGTRPIVILNPAIEKLKVVYTAIEGGGDIVYKESSTSTISFGPQTVLINGVLDNATSTKNNYTSEIVILAAGTSNAPNIFGVLARDLVQSEIPDIPELLSPYDSTTETNLDPILSWNTSVNAITYHVQVSIAPDFTTIVFDQGSLATPWIQLDSLTTNTRYHWRVQAMNAIGVSDWSAVWSFSTISQIPPAPILLNPADLTIDVPVDPTLEWSASANATSYQIQLSVSQDFSAPVVNQSNITSTAYQVSNLFNDTTYYWRVRAINSIGNSNWSSTWSFTTQEAISNTLVGYWKMDEDSVLTLMDESIFGNSAALQGSPVWVEGVYGMALKLNGTNQFATVAHAPSLDASPGITLAAWIRPERNASQYILQKGEIVDGYVLSLLSTGKVSFRFNEITSSDYKINSNALYPIDGMTWMHVAATYNGSVAKIYIDGVRNKMINFSSPALIHVNKAPLTIGAKNSGKSSLKGAMDEVYIYNYALTDAEILELALTSGSTSGSRVADRKYAEMNLSTEQPEEEHDIIVYPNPAGDRFWLEFSGLSGKDVSVSLSNLQGRIHFKVNALIENNKLEINLNDLNLNAGMYLIQIQSASYFKVIKFIKT